MSGVVSISTSDQTARTSSGLCDRGMIRSANSPRRTGEMGTMTRLEIDETAFVSEATLQQWCDRIGGAGFRGTGYGRP